MPQKRVKEMTYEELADETMLLRAQVKVLQNWIALHKSTNFAQNYGTMGKGFTFDGSPEAQEQIRQRFGPYHD